MSSVVVAWNGGPEGGGTPSNTAKDGKRKASVSHEIVNAQSTSPITQKYEFYVWYLYEAANGAFFYSVNTYLPILITFQAQVYGMLNYCATSSTDPNCFANGGYMMGSCDLAGDYNSTSCAASNGTWTASINPEATKVNFLGMNLYYASVAPYCSSISVVLQLILFSLLGSFADYGNLRKVMFIFFNTIGVGTCAAHYLLGEYSDYELKGILWIVGVASFTLCIVFYNSYLAVLTASHPTAHAARTAGKKDEELYDIIMELTHAESLKGYAAGFTGQLVFQLIAIYFIIPNVEAAGLLHLRTTVFGAGIWVLALSSFTFIFIKNRPGIALPEGESYMGRSLSQAYRTMKSFKELPSLGIYLFSFFIYSDGIQTIAATTGVFAVLALGLTVSELTMTVIIVSLASLTSVFVFKIFYKLGMKPKHILLCNIFGMLYIPIMAVFAITTKTEFYIAVIVFGLMSGSEQSFSRSVYSQYIPAGYEAEYFAFYELSDKGTAWLGPLIFGIVLQSTGDIRLAYASPIFFFFVGGFILLFFNPEKAEEERKAFEKLHKRKAL